MSAWVVVLAMLGPAGDDVPGLVARLSAPRKADRDRASARLEAIGEPARPALLEAAESADLERRARAAAVLDAIEGGALVRPTLVALDFKDRTVAEVVDALAARSGLPLALDPRVEPALAGRLITLEAPGPVPFWEAIGQLGEAGGVRPEPGPGPRNSMMMMRGNPMAMARPGPARALTGRELLMVPAVGPAAPSARSGRLLVVLTGMQLRRDRYLPGAGGRPPGRAADRLEVRLRVIPEPGLTVASVGEPESVEAEDDRGRPLAPPGPVVEPTTGPATMAGGFANGPYGQAQSSALIRLRDPDRPGATIRRLAAALPVTILGSRPGPASASLVRDLGKAVHAGDVALTVHSVGPGPEGQPGLLSAEITLDCPEGVLGMVGMGNPRLGGGGRAGPAAPPSAQGWLEFVDAQGRPTERLPAAGLGLGDGRRRTVRIASGRAGAGTPVEVRYLAPTWATVRVPVEFRGLPVP